MDLTALRPLISATALTDVVVCRAELIDIGVVRGLLDARELAVVRRLDELAANDPALFPQAVVADAAKSSLMAAQPLRDRAGTCDAIPELGAALTAGATTGDRVDIVVKATVGLNASERALLAGQGRRLALAASEQTATGFRKTVEHVVRQIREDDGLAKLARQTRMARLRWFTDGDGMWCLSGRFDPATGARLEGTLRNAIDRKFAAGMPDTCPLDPTEKQQHLAALALAAMLLGDDSKTATGSGAGAPDVTVIIDAETLLTGHAHEGTVYDIGLGRETRIANRAQRRALRALYRSCALCEVPFDHCQIHHITWYSLGGLTDIDELIPICNKHHHLVHEGGWQLHLAADRTLTVTQPGGNQFATGPPTIRAA